MGKNIFRVYVMVSFGNRSFHSLMLWKTNQKGDVLIEYPATSQRLQSLGKVSSLTHVCMYEQPPVLNTLLGTMGNVTKTHATKYWLLSGKKKKTAVI